LAQDHAKAQLVARELETAAWVESVLPVETNAILFELGSGVGAESLLEHLRARDILALASGRNVRLVFHLDVSEAQTDVLVESLRAFSPEPR
jgi:threonine aldolase